MSQQQKLEMVLDLLLSEDSDQAAELLHQIIVEKARVIYENIVEEDDMEDDKEELDEGDEVGGEPSKDFTDEIKSDTEEIDADEENDGEASAEDDDEEGDEEVEDEFDSEFDGEEGSVEDRVEDLEMQLDQLRQEFEALMGEEFEEPQHADLPDEFADIEDEGGDDFGGDDMPDFGGGENEQVVGEVVAVMHEKKKADKLKVAPQKKDMKKDKKMDEETQFLKKVSDTGQKSASPGYAGTGKDTPKGAEQDKSVFTRAPSKPSYGGTTQNILGSKTTGGEYGKYHGDSAKDDTPSDNVDVKGKKNSMTPMSSSDKTEGKFVGTGKGSQSGKTDTKSLLTTAPRKPMGSGK